VLNRSDTQNELFAVDSQPKHHGLYATRGQISSTFRWFKVTRWHLLSMKIEAHPPSLYKWDQRPKMVRQHYLIKGWYHAINSFHSPIRILLMEWEKMHNLSNDQQRTTNNAQIVHHHSFSMKKPKHQTGQLLGKDQSWNRLEWYDLDVAGRDVVKGERECNTNQSKCHAHREVDVAMAWLK